MRVREDWGQRHKHLCALWRAIAPPAGAPTKKRHPIATAIWAKHLERKTAGGGSARQTTPTALRRLAFKRRSSPCPSEASDFLRWRYHDPTTRPLERRARSMENGRRRGEKRRKKRMAQGTPAPTAPPPRGACRVRGGARRGALTRRRPGGRVGAAAGGCRCYNATVVLVVSKPCRIYYRNTLRQLHQQKRRTMPPYDPFFNHTLAAWVNHT